jgi:predicted CXXCH cytochrome family protein
MRDIFKIILVLSIVILVSTCAPEPTVRKGFAPKPCLDCHKEKLNELQKKYVHAPMSNRDCEACHLRHGKLPVKTLKEREEIKLCYLCHSQMAQNMDKMAHVHTALKQGRCLPCHNPHASDNKYLLKKTGNELCFTCHKEASFIRAKRHKPLSDGCQTCHAPHGSQHKDNLIKGEVELCQSCHNFTAPSFRKGHKDYPVERAGCTECHTAHSSTNDRLLRESIHTPLKLVQCASCHKPPTDPKPFSVIAPDGKLCYSCHKKEESAFKTAFRHRPLEEGKCLSCHSPHATDYPEVTLMGKNELCISCHADMSGLLKVSNLHAPIKDKGCTACHDT